MTDLSCTASKYIISYISHKMSSKTCYPSMLFSSRRHCPYTPTLVFALVYSTSSWQLNYFRCITITFSEICILVAFFFIYLLSGTLYSCNYNILRVQLYFHKILSISVTSEDVSVKTEQYRGPHWRPMTRTLQAGVCCRLNISKLISLPTAAEVPSLQHWHIYQTIKLPER